MRKWLKRAMIAGGVALPVLQLVPYGREHSNPPVVEEPRWIDPEVRALAARACFDCHSNETTWPWYSNVAPISWLVQHDTDEGRSELNFSEWHKPQREAHDAAKHVTKGDMPPKSYLLAHPEARLSPEERQRLIDGFTTMFGDGKKAREAAVD